MRAPAVSFAKRLVAALMAALLTFALLPANALAEGEGSVNTSAEGTQEVDSAQADEAAGANASEGTEPATAMRAPLASVLAGAPTTFVNADVALDGEPVVGSFTVDGLTFAVTEGSDVELVGAAGAEGAFGSEVPTSPQPPSAPMPEAEALPLVLPESVSYDDVEYSVTSIGAYAFYLSGVASVELPASVINVDDRAFRSSDVASVEVAEGNPNYSSFDGALYDADQSSLLLIPEGKQGTVLLPKAAESAAPSVFSHCPLVTQVSVEEGSAAFASENGLLYDASLETLLRVPAGATDITIREGCTTIAAGAMEACASLERINAPSSVASISPDAFTSVPTISLPTSLLASGDAPAQLNTLVGLSARSDCLQSANASDIAVYVKSATSAEAWAALGFSVEDASCDLLQSASTYGYGSGGINYVKIPTTQTWYHAGRGTGGTPIGGTFSSQFGAWGTWGSQWSTLTYTGEQLVLRFSDQYSNGGVTPESDGVYSVKKSSSAKGPFTEMEPGDTISLTGDIYLLINGAPRPDLEYSITWDKCSNDPTASLEREVDYVGVGDDVVVAPSGTSHDRVVEGWYATAADAESRTNRLLQPGQETPSATKAENRTYYAAWLPKDYTVSFDVDSEPGDEDYPGIEKPDETVNVESGPTVIEDPKRPGYVFQGWTIPNAESTEAIDQELVYKDETDGKWYVDASKLPDYANNEGRVELTARWTSVISVDVPSAVTFYADVVTEGQESREGAASSAFGQNKVASQSQVDLRIVGLESSAVATQGSTLGADSILKKATSATPSSSTQKLFSLYPTDEALTADDLQDPDAVSAAKPVDAVDFALDDLLLEKSFAADKFTIPAGDTLNLGYRLNLSETGTELDYEKLSTLDEGQSASIANISYCFAAKRHFPTATGSKDDPLYIEYEGHVYGLQDIKDSAECIAQDGVASPCYELYKTFLDAQVMVDGNPGVGPYFQLKVDGRYLDLQLIGICQDVKSDGSGKAGLTFQLCDIYAYGNTRSTAAGGGSFNSRMKLGSSNEGGWGSSDQRSTLRSTFWEFLTVEVQNAIVPVDKFQQLSTVSGGTGLQGTTDETIWLPSMYEVFGTSFSGYNAAEGQASNGYTPFQYMAYKGNAGATTNVHAIKTYNDAPRAWWTRSAQSHTTIYYCYLESNGSRYFNYSNNTYGVAPAFCL